MILLILGKHLMWSRPNSSGGTDYYYYYDSVTWVVGALAFAWLAWFLVRRYRRARSLRRPPRRVNRKLPRRIIRIKSELSSVFLQPGFSRKIHAVGIGIVGGDKEYCIQVFINGAKGERWGDSKPATSPTSYRGVPVVPIEMPVAGFLANLASNPVSAPDAYRHGIREHQEVIIGGISGANTKLTGQSGTIGYFCTRKSKLRRRKEIHLLSNSHVFADLEPGTVDPSDLVDQSDLIAQPSPGESSNNRPIGALVKFLPLKFETGLDDPNHIDAAIARLWSAQPHQPVIPLIGAVKSYVMKRDIEIGEPARKFGRTTGYTEGRIFSLCLDIRIRYDRTGKSAFFQNQILIEPSLPQYAKFVAKGDSGSLLVDARENALGLIFAGTAELPKSSPAVTNKPTTPEVDQAADRLRHIESYGVANPISEVLDRLKIDLLV